MAVLSTHHPLPFIFGILGNVISFLVFLAPLPTFIRIYKKKSTEGFQSVPYLVALLSSMLWLYYAMLKRRDALLLITINSFGCFIETLYISLYIAFAPKENRDWTIKVLAAMNMGLFSSILLITQFLVNRSIRVQVLGWICVAFSVSVFASPLSIVAQVIRTKSVEFMPINLSIALTLSAIAWLGYGLFSKDICVAVPNVLGFILGLLQILLYGVFRNSKKFPEEKLQEENLKAIVVVNTSGNSEEIKEPANENPPQIELPCKTNEQNLVDSCALKTVEVVVA